MKTYQDLIALGENEEERMEFVLSAIKAHKDTEAYKMAEAAEEYYAKKNVTISKFQKVIYDVLGQARADPFSANYQLKTLFFRRFVLQQTQYVLSNGVTFTNAETDRRLGPAFDGALSRLAKKAMVDGMAFGFWNLDHLEIFGLADTPKEPGFAPLYDEDTSLLRAGVRYSTSREVLRATLYEEDGYTEYIRRKGGRIEILTPKRGYIHSVTANAFHGVEAEEESNYPGFPIIPLYANDLKESELVGIRESIDCYDFIKSGLANEIDDSSGFYWVLQNSGGMDDIDLQRFIERIKMLKAVSFADDQTTAAAHTLDIPTAARDSMLDRLRSDLYEDFMLLDTEKALSGNITATGIRLAYQAQDDKCGDFEYCIRDFISKLFALLGIDDEPAFKWNRIANQTEETNMVLAAANYLDDEAILNHLPWIQPEEVEKILKRRDAESLNRLSALDMTGQGNENDVPPPSMRR